MQELKDKLRHADDEIRSLKLDKISLESEVGATQMELDSLTRNFNDLQEALIEFEQSKSEASEAEIKLEVLTTEHIATAAQLSAVCSDLAATKSSAQAELDCTAKKWEGENSNLKFEINVLKSRGAAHVGFNDNNSEECASVDNVKEDEAVLRARIKERDEKISSLESEIVRSEQLRRMMHNCIQELRGNIRVFVRTRPFLPGDGYTGSGDNSTSAISILPDGESLAIHDNLRKCDHKFPFDKVFPPSSGQDNVFDKVADFV